MLLGLYMSLFAYFKESIQFPEKPPEELGRIDNFNDTYILVYMPISNRTEQIMNKTASIFKGKYTNEKKLLILFYISIRCVYV